MAALQRIWRAAVPKCKAGSFYWCDSYWAADQKAAVMWLHFTSCFLYFPLVCPPCVFLLLLDWADSESAPKLQPVLCISTASEQACPRVASVEGRVGLWRYPPTCTAICNSFYEYSPATSAERVAGRWDTVSLICSSWSEYTGRMLKADNRTLEPSTVEPTSKLAPAPETAFYCSQPKGSH